MFCKKYGFFSEDTGLKQKNHKQKNKEQYK